MLLVTPAELVIIGDVAVVDDRQIREAVAQKGCEWLRSTRDSVESRVWPKPCVPRESRDAVGALEIIRRAHLLDDLQRRPS